MDKWRVYHDWRRLVDDGKIGGKFCSCGTQYTTSIDKNDDPMLICLGCFNRLFLGLDFYDEARGLLRSSDEI